PPACHPRWSPRRPRSCLPRRPSDEPPRGEELDNGLGAFLGCAAYDPRRATGRRLALVGDLRPRRLAANCRIIEAEVGEGPSDDLLRPRGHDPLERRVARLAEQLCP